MIELQQLVNKKVFTPVVAWKLQPGQTRSAIWSSMFLKEEFVPEGDFLKLKSTLVACGDQPDITCVFAYCFYYCDLHSADYSSSGEQACSYYE